MPYARVVTWEGGDAESIRTTIDEIKERAGSGPPEGVPSTGITFLVDPDGGRVMAVGLFETEDDYRQGDETLSQMDPPGDGFGRRAGVEKWEVALDIRVDGAS